MDSTGASNRHFWVDRRMSSTTAVAMGRWLKFYKPNVGMCRRPISPQYGRYAPDGSSMGVLAELLKDATGKSELDELLLLVAPGSHRESPKVHCFAKETRDHLGMMRTTPSEVDILREYEDLLRYQLRFTHEHCSVMRMTCDRETIARFFDRSCGGMETQEQPLFEGSLNFSYPATPPEGSPNFSYPRTAPEGSPNFSYPSTAPREFSSVGIQAQMSKSKIRALWKPRIPVRLRNLENIRRSRKMLSLTNFKNRSRLFL